jgi:hypothetical protein
MSPERRLSPAERFFLPLGMLLLVLAQYRNTLTLDRPFLLDDHTAILTQPDVTGPGGWRNLWWHAADPTQPGIVAEYQPLTVLSYHLNARMAGGPPKADLFRLVNIVLLGLVGIGTARWLRWRVPPALAWSAGFLLVAHPTNVEIINCVSGRAELLAVLGVLIFALRQRGAMHRGGWTIPGGVAALLAALLALGSGIAGLLLVPMALAQRWSGLPPRTIPPPRPRTEAAGRPRGPGEPVSVPQSQPPPPLSTEQWHIVSAVTALLLVAGLLAYVAGRTAALGWGPHPWPDPATPGWGDLFPNPILDVSWPRHIPAALALAGLYLRQLVWPDLSSNLVPAALPGWGSLATWLGALVLGSGLAALTWAIRRRSWVLVPLALALGHYLLVCQLLLPLPQYASNRFMLPFNLAAVLALTALVNRFLGTSMRARAAVVIATFAVTLVLSARVVIANGSWDGDGQRIAADAEAQLDNPTAMYRSAARLSAMHGNAEKIRDQLNDILACRPGSVQARIALAELELRTGNRERAAALYRAILADHPSDVRAAAGLTGLAGTAAGH